MSDSDRKYLLISDIDILQRKLTGLKDAMSRRPLSAGQERFIMTYLEMISDFIDKGLDILDENKYREELKMLDE